MDITSYLLGKNASGGGGTPKLQNKTITITENTTTTITPDEGYDGLGSVEIITNVETGGLPSTYQAVSYIQSSGTQYIDTGIKSASDLKINVTIQYFSGSSGLLYGGGIGWENQYIQGECDTSSYFAYGNRTANFNQQPTNGAIYNVIQDKNVIYLNDVNKLNLAAATFSTNYNIYLFTFNRSGEVGEFGSYKLKECKIYKSNVLVRQFIPCYRKSDNVIGLYDIVGNTFYTNSGTGDFTKGIDI